VPFERRGQLFGMLFNEGAKTGFIGDLSQHALGFTDAGSLSSAMATDSTVRANGQTTWRARGFWSAQARWLVLRHSSLNISSCFR
jgi:hypothetical protein